MTSLEQITLSLKGNEINTWNRLRQTYPRYKKHDILLLSMKTLLNKNTIKRTKTWKEVRQYYQEEKSDWNFIQKVLEEFRNSITQ